MEKTSCNIPTPEELRNYIKESVISVTGTYEQSASVLMVDDSTIGTLGNFSASIGKAKSKKTFNVSAIAAAALKNGTVLHYRACFPEGKRKILYVDTEQGKNHCQIVLNLSLIHISIGIADGRPGNVRGPLQMQISETDQGIKFKNLVTEDVPMKIRVDIPTF